MKRWGKDSLWYKDPSEYEEACLGIASFDESTEVQLGSDLG